MTHEHAAVSTVVSIVVKTPSGNGIQELEGLKRQIYSGLAGI